MTKTILTAHILQWLLLILLTAAVMQFLSFMNVYGFFLASVTTFFAYGAYKNKRWAYFALAVWGLACYQLAKAGYEFQTIKHLAMSLGILVIPAALFLHEMLGKQQNTNAQKSVTHAVSDDDLRQ